MKKLLSAVCAASALTVVPAYSADLLIETAAEPESSAAFDWSGFYAGVNGGYGWATVENSVFPDIEAEGWVGGAQLGYNADMGGVVLGVEGDFQLTGIQDVEALMVYTRTINLDYFGTLRARAGVAMGSVMAYVTAGALVGQGTLQFDDGVTTYTDSQTHFGWSAGAGVEVAASDTVSIKGEVLYNDAGSKTYFDGDPLFEADAHPTFTIVRAGVNVHF